MVVHLFELDRWRRDLIVAAVTERLRRNFSLGNDLSFGTLKVRKISFSLSG